MHDDILTSENSRLFRDAFATDSASRRIESRPSRVIRTSESDIRVGRIEAYSEDACVYILRSPEISPRSGEVEEARQVLMERRRPYRRTYGELLAYKSRIPIRGRKYFEVLE